MSKNPGKTWWRALFARHGLGDRLDALSAGLDRIHQALDNQSTAANERWDRVHQGLNDQSAATNERFDQIREALDNQSTTANERWDRLREALDNQSAATNDRWDRICQGLDNQSAATNARWDRLREALDNQSASTNERWDRVSQGLDNQSAATNERWDRLRETLDNQSAATNDRWDRVREALEHQSTRLEQVSEKVDQFRQAPHYGPGRSARIGQQKPCEPLKAPADPVTDLVLVEEFAHNWQANARRYRGTIKHLSRAAKRLLAILESSGQSRPLSNADVLRLRALEDHVACLARQPLFYPEMFHGVQLLPNGGFLELDERENQHLRASGLLGHEDQVAMKVVYERLLAQCRSPLKVAEIGSAAGRGSTKIAGDFVRRSSGTLYCIDPWSGSRYFAFLANMQIFDLESAVMPVRSASSDAAVLFEDHSLDAVFIDGSHTYKDALADIDLYLPKIRKHGIIFGHDLHDLPSRFDRQELLRVSHLNNAEVNYTATVNGERHRVNVQPGVILAVQDRFGDEVERFPGSVVWARHI